MMSAIEKTKEYFKDSEQSIEYKKPISEIQELKAALNKKYNADVGRESFEVCLNKARSIK